MSCSCAERFNVHGNRMPEGEWTHLHDCLYVSKRNKLIPKAEQAVIDENGHTMPGARFTRLFANKMQELARQNKLIQ